MIEFKVEKIDNGFLVKADFGYEFQEETGKWMDDFSLYGMDLPTTLDILVDKIQDVLETLDPQFVHGPDAWDFDEAKEDTPLGV